MDKRKLYTPEGVQDILLNECYVKRNIEQRIRKHLRYAGYHELETPSIEFYNVFSEGSGAIGQEAMFKFSDKDGRLLVLRPDMTVPTARVFATKLKEMTLPMKFFYIGNVFRLNEFGGGRSKEFTQAGIEIIGAPGPEADGEVIAEAILLAQTAGLSKFQIDIGQVDFFKGLVEEAGMSEELGEKVRFLVDRKDYAQLRRLLDENSIPQHIKELLLDLPTFFGDMDILDKIAVRVGNKRSLEAIENLKRILSIVEDYGLLEYVSIDLGMLNSLHYYTGVVFKGFTYGLGFPILSGGRYDTLIENYGFEASATGFCLGINLIMRALSRQGVAEAHPPCEAYIGYAPINRRRAIKVSSDFKNRGISAYLDLVALREDEGLEYARVTYCNLFVYFREDNSVRYCNLSTGIDNVIDYETFEKWGFRI